MKLSLDRRTILITAAVALVAILVLFVARSGPLASMRVTVAPVVRADLAPLLFGIGVVEARRSYLVGPTVAGRVRHVAVDVGDVVKAGQLLAAAVVPGARSIRPRRNLPTASRDAKWPPPMRAAMRIWGKRVSSVPA